MALRVAGNKPPVEAPIEEPMPEAEMPMAEEAAPMEEEPVDPMAEGATGGGVIDPVIAGYKGPEMGPFMCGNCVHYGNDGSCALLTIPVDEMGVCNLFTPAPAEDDEQMMAEEEMPADQPPQEPMPEGEPYPEDEAFVTA